MQVKTVSKFQADFLLYLYTSYISRYTMTLRTFCVTDQLKTQVRRPEYMLDDK